MRKLLFYGLILVLLFGAMEVSATLTKREDVIFMGEGNTLIKGFEASKADFLEINVNSTLHLTNRFFTMEEMQDIQEALMKELNIEGKIQVITHNENFDPYFMMLDHNNEASIYIQKNEEIGYNQITITNIDKDGNMIYIILYSADIENLKESHIIIDIVKNKEYKDIETIIMRHKEILINYGDKIVNTATIVGTITGQMSSLENQRWLESIIEALGAEKVEEVTDGTYSSITLYTPGISRAIQYNTNKINLQLASRYNQYEDKTYLWIATPLITNTY